MKFKMIDYVVKMKKHSSSAEDQLKSIKDVTVLQHPVLDISKDRIIRDLHEPSLEDVAKHFDIKLDELELKPPSALN